MFCISSFEENIFQTSCCNYFVVAGCRCVKQIFRNANNIILSTHEVGIIHLRFEFVSLQSRLEDSEQNFKVSWGDEQTGCVLKTSEELPLGDWGDWCPATWNMGSD